MIDKKKIEQEIERNIKALFADRRTNELDAAFTAGFKLGLYWLLDNIWHDGSDAPTYAEKCLVELTDDYNDSNKLYVVSAEYRGGGWDCNVSDLVREDYKITRWLYISDLLIGGEE